MDQSPFPWIACFNSAGAKVHVDSDADQRELGWKCGSVFACKWTLVWFTYVSDVAQLGRGRLAEVDEVGCSAACQERPVRNELRSADVPLSSSGAFHTHRVQRGFWHRRQGCRQRALTPVSVKPKSSWTYFTVVGKRWGKDALALCKR